MTLVLACVCARACFPAECREHVRGRSAQPPVRAGADEPRSTAPEGRALSRRRCPCNPAQSSAPAGKMSADGPCAARSKPPEVHISTHTHTHINPLAPLSAATVPYFNN